MIMPGVIDQGGYVPPAQFGVTLNNASMKTGTINCSDNGLFSFAGWFKTAWTNSTYFWLRDQDGASDYLYLMGYASGGNPAFDWYMQQDPSGGYRNADIIVEHPPLISGQWQHLIGCMDCNFAAPSKKMKVYVDDADSGSTNTGQTGPAGHFNVNGHYFYIGDDGYGSFFEGSVADFSMWPGVSFFDTNWLIGEDVRRLFIDQYGMPVDPQVAIDELGSPAVMLTGGISTFLNNSLGTSGPMTLLEGSLANAPWG